MLIDSVSYYVTMLQIYGFMVLMIIVFPAVMWRSYFRRTKRGVGFNFLFCVLTQECFITNLVLLLGFFKIANRYTMLLGFIIEYAIVRWKTYYLPHCTQPYKHHYQLKQPVTIANLRDFVRHYLLDLRLRFVNYREWSIWDWLRRRWFIVLMMTTILVYNCLFLNHNILTEGHCYQFSDCPVHTNWVYMLTHGVLFSAGIYPFYMHAMLYAVHTMSGIHLREVVLYFGAGQTLLLICGMYMLGRKLFKNNVVAFVPLVVFSLLMNNGRYAASLPQESGMFACMALGYFMLSYLQSDRPRHLLTQDKKIRGIFRLNAYWFRHYFTIDLQMIMICVASVIGFHFYTAIAAIILVFSFAVAYLPRLLNKHYWLPLFTAGVLGAFIAVAPFIACLAQGIPFQESMSWAMSLINGDQWVNEQQASYSDLLNGTTEDTEAIADVSRQEEPVSDNSEKVIINLHTVFDAMNDTVMYAVPPNAPKATRYTMWSIMLICFASSITMYVFKQSRWIGAGYLAYAIYSMIMLLLGSMSLLGLPMVVERQRIPVFLQPFLFMLVAVPFDILTRIILHISQGRAVQIIAKGITAFACITLIVLCMVTGNLHHFFDLNRTYYNESEYILRHIRESYPAQSFIVVSPTDDYYGVVDEGYHTELSELMGMVQGTREAFTLPTEYNFILIEKKVLQDIQYGTTYIQPEFAKERFVFTGLTQDYYYQRAILQSKAYYWAQAMVDTYPESFQVYFQNDYMLAYLLHQNPYYPFDLRIDYSRYVDKALSEQHT